MGVDLLLKKIKIHFNLVLEAGNHEAVTLLVDCFHAARGNTRQFNSIQPSSCCSFNSPEPMFAVCVNAQKPG